MLTLRQRAARVGGLFGTARRVGTSRIVAEEVVPSIGNAPIASVLPARPSSSSTSPSSASPSSSTSPLRRPRALVTPSRSPPPQTLADTIEETARLSRKTIHRTSRPWTVAELVALARYAYQKRKTTVAAAKDDADVHMIQRRRRRRRALAMEGKRMPPVATRTLYASQVDREAWIIH